jgi:hypothetical protein
MTAEAPQNGSLQGASINRLACLVRHWTWADEARERFERALAHGWEYDEDHAKIAGLVVPSLMCYRPMINRMLLLRGVVNEVGRLRTDRV